MRFFDWKYYLKKFERRYFLILLGTILLGILAACAKEREGETAADTEVRTAAAAVEQARPEESPEMLLGKRVFSSCASCHTAGVGGTIGPGLSGILGATAASRPDFAYSEALRQSEIIWTEESLDRYIEDPAAVVPGGTMAFVGVKDGAKRQAVIAYLISTTVGDNMDPSLPSNQGEDVAVWE